ncbi:MAG: DNA polymerase III subunit delta [Chlorobiales bacterium]|nr:DNA polymerase III subunit delta [Chlorobiales bacterium]
MSLKASFGDLETAIRKKRFEPVYFFYGQEEFLVEELIGLLKANVFRAADEVDLNYTQLYGHDHTLGDVVSSASEYPMFSEQRLVVVRAFDHLRKERTKEKQQAQLALFASYLKNPLASTVLVLAAAKLDKATLAKEPYPLLKEVSYEFAQIKDPGSFVLDRAKRFGWHLTPDAVKMLVSFVGTSARDLNTEVEKLALYAEGKAGEKTLTDKDVIQTVGLSREYNVFELEKAVASRDLRQASGMAMMILEQEGLKDGVFAIVNYFTMFFTRLWKLQMPSVRRMSQPDMAKELGMYGGQVYFLKEYMNYAERFSLGDIENALIALHEADLKLKGIDASDDEKLLVLTLIRKILSPNG